MYNPAPMGVTLSIIIVNYNVANLLCECLRSILANDGVSFEVWVVDNGSTDHSADMVRRGFPSVRLIEIPVNKGYAHANNLGLEKAKGDYLLLLNPDTVLPSDGLRKMVDFMQEHREAGIAGPKLVRRDGSLDPACRRSFPTPLVSFYRLTGLSQLFPQSKRFARYNLTYLDPDRIAEVDSVVGAFMLVRRRAMEEAGLLDERFFLYGEDLDWAIRIKNKGWKVLYNPEVTVLHYKAESSRQEIRQATVEFYRSMLVFYRKHYAPSTGPIVNWIITIAIGLRFAYAYVVNLLLTKGKRRVNY